MSTIDVKNLLNDHGINNAIFNHAKKMDIDLMSIFREKIFNNYNIKSFEEVKSCLLGVYGNYITTLYYKGLGYDVKNEEIIYDENGKEITKADVSFKDENGNKYLVEVKTAPKILSNKNYYYDDKIVPFFVKDDKKYIQMGKKLINQVAKLKTCSSFVIVSIFNGCILDDEIKEKLESLKVHTHTISLDIKELTTQVINMIIDIKEDYDELLNNKRRLVA